MRPIVRYHGGKWRLAPWVIQHMPDTVRYIEPFCGAASVLLRRRRVSVEVINDCHGRLVNVFRVLRNPVQAERLAEMLRLTPCSQLEYLDAREQAEDPVEDARRMIVLGHQAHGSTGASGGKLSGWRRGVRSHGPTSSREWAGLWREVEGWCDRLGGVYIESGDALAIIRRWDAPDALIYVDPPYPMSTRTTSGRLGRAGYAHDYSDADHERLAETLGTCRARVLVSGYRCPLYDRLFADWDQVERSVSADAGARRTECLWANYHLDVSIPHLLWDEAEVPA
jgi:DNA adenine methylase